MTGVQTCALPIFVINLQELIEEVDKAKSKVVDIDVNAIADPRKRAVEQERKEQMESIEKSAYVVNDKAGVLTINDLDITLALNSPYDLSNISAKRIAGSSELKSLLKAGYIKFIDPKEIDGYVKKAEEGHTTYGYEVFDNHEQAEAHMTQTEAGGINLDTPSTLHSQPTAGNGNNSMEITSADMDTPTEEEAVIMDLTSAIGKSNTGPSVRSSRHGSS